jgi:ATP-dependent Clp protease ATP-binding subunit ClpC
VSIDELFSLEQATRNTATQHHHRLDSAHQADREVLKITYLRLKSSSEIIGTEHLLLPILRDEDNISSNSLQVNVNY